MLAVVLLVVITDDVVVKVVNGDRVCAFVMFSAVLHLLLILTLKE